MKNVFKLLVVALSVSLVACGEEHVVKLVDLPNQPKVIAKMDGSAIANVKDTVMVSYTYYSDYTIKAGMVPKTGHVTTYGKDSIPFTILYYKAVVIQ